MTGADGDAAAARAAIAFDHLAVAAETLEAGAAFLEDRLGVAPDPGGAHPRMGTHNRLLSLGPEAYLELIAIDPAAPSPDRPRWFGLDGFRGAPRLVGWVARTTALRPPPGTSVSAQSRGDLRWQIALPEDGRPMAGGALPMLIDWQGGPHPAPRLPDRAAAGPADAGVRGPLAGVGRNLGPADRDRTGRSSAKGADRDATRGGVAVAQRGGDDSADVVRVGAGVVVEDRGGARPQVA